jgi:hypothetical protein
MWNDRYTRFGFSVAGRASFDPVTLTAASLTATAVGGGLSAAGTLAGGSAAAEAGQLTKSADYAQADQLEQNATQEIASGQRKMLDTQQRVRLAMSTAKARGGGSGFSGSSGSQIDNMGQLAKRGSYNAAMDMFNGESAASGLRNQAKAARYSGDVAELTGQEQQDASYLSAAGTIAGTAGSMAKGYGGYKYPTAPKGAYG